VAEGIAAADEPLADGTVALFNRGTPSSVVTPDGTLWMSLLRACSSWPSGVWIDGERRTAPDGSSFAWQHWSHTFSYALTFAAQGWREAGCNAAAEDYNHDLVAVVTGDAGRASGAGVWVDGAPNVSLTALKPFGNPLAVGRPGTPGAAGTAGTACTAGEPGAPGTAGAEREITVRLRETDGRLALARLRLAGGIDAAWRYDILEQLPGMPLPVRDGSARLVLSPFETVTVMVRPARAPAPSLPNAQSTRSSQAESATGRTASGAEPPEPAQPVFSRYWLHGKGPAPAGNLPVAVHLTPTRATLRSGGPDGDDTGRLRLTVACGPSPAAGSAELLVPDGLIAQVGDAPAASGTLLRYDLPGGGFASWDITVRAADPAPPGRFFLTARIRDGLGQVLEDAALVTVGEPGGPDASLPPEELFSRLQTDVQALDGEADMELLTPHLRLAPGQRGELTARVVSHLASPLRGEVQLISPIGTWQATDPWTQSVTADPGGEATVRFAVAVPATAEPGWQSWLLVKLMYFGRVRYSRAIPLTVI
jgi:alpha-mannosidase